MIEKQINDIFIESQAFGKRERLYLEKDFEDLWKKNKSFYIHPIKIYWTRATFKENYPAKFAVSVPKKKIKSAVERNKIKRQIKEVYRKNKNTLYSYLKSVGGQCMILSVYQSNKKISFEELELKIKLSLDRLIKEYEKNN